MLYSHTASPHSFVQMLPANQDKNAPGRKPQPHQLRPDSQQPTIFILEDERLVAENLKIILEENGYVVLGIAASGEEALESVRRLEPDLLIMDIRVHGEMDGVETAILIHETLGKRIPTIFLTAHAKEHFGHIAKLDPASFIYLTKPYVDGELLAAVRKLLGKTDATNA